MKYNLASIPTSNHQSFTKLLNHLNLCQFSADCNDNRYRRSEVRGIIFALQTLGYDLERKEDGSWDLA